EGPPPPTGRRGGRRGGGGATPVGGLTWGGFGGVRGGRAPPSGRVEAVADAPDGGDVDGVAQLLADLGHVDVDGAGVAVPPVAPDTVEDLLAGQGPAAVLGQVAEQLELLAGEVDDHCLAGGTPTPEA